MKRISMLVVIALVVVIDPWAQAPPGAQGHKIGEFANVPEPAASTVIYCGTLIDGKSQPRHSVQIVLDGAQIEEMRTDDRDQLTPAGAKLIDLRGETCLPGLIDTHTHVLLQGDITAEDYDRQLLKWSPEYRTILGTQSARKALEYGFHDDS